MSEQAPRTTAATSVAATVRPMVLVLDHDDIDFTPFRQIEDVTDEPLLVAEREPEIGRRDLWLAHQEQIDVVGRQRIVERGLDRIAWSRRTHDPRRDDDGEIGLLLLIGGAAEQRAEHRDIADPGDLVLRGRADIQKQTAEHEALAVAQLDG